MTPIFAHAAGHPIGQDDHPLLEAARVALKANPRFRMIKMRIESDGTPIEIPDVVPTQSDQEN